MNIVAVIPCYNERMNIGLVVKETKNYVDTVVVIDNLSTDDTAEIAEKAGAEVWKCPWRGAGAATKLGLEFAKGYYNADMVITLDGDGQHNPADIWIMANALVHSDIVIGSRFVLPYKVPRYRKFGIDVINFFYNFGHKEKLKDTQSCLRAINRKALQSINIEEMGFGFSVEYLIKARKLGLKITEVPVECIYHKSYAQNSTLNPIKHGLLVLWAVIKWRIKLAN